MDTEILSHIGHSLYKTEILKEWKRYVVFRTRCMMHSSEISGLLDFFAATPLRRDMLHHTTSFVEQATRQFFYKNSSYSGRIALIKEHVEFLESKMTEEALRRLYAKGEMLRLWEDSYDEKPLTLELWFHAGQRKEGCLSLVLMWDKEALYQIMFWLEPDKDGKPALWIGALQGTPNGSEVIKGLTKAFFGYRTKNLIFYGIRNVAEVLGCERIYAVSNEGYYAMNHVRMDRKLKTSLDAFWQECEGQPVADDKRFYEIPIPEYRKSMEELKPSKRAQHRRRFAKMDEMKEAIAANMKKYLKA